jgi:photosystem II stability/assembly factor-like uncharacterized protein
MGDFRLFTVLALLIAGCSTQNTERENAAYWQAMSPADQATVTAIVRNGSKLLVAGTEAGLFISEDGGTSWRISSPADWRVSAILITTNQSILAGTYRHGIKKSSDGGRSWIPVGFEQNVYVDGLIESRGGQIYAAVAHSVGDEPTGVFLSDDDGETWIQAGLSGENAYSVSSPQTGHLYVGTDSGTYRSIDAGLTWSRVESLSFPTPLSQVIEHDGVLMASFAERRYRKPGRGVFLSLDDGASWQKMGGFPPNTSVHALAVIDDAVYAATGDLQGLGGMGIYRSIDQQQWEQVGLEQQWLKSLLPSADGTLFVGAVESGMFESQRDGTAWVPRSDGLRNWNPTALTVDASNRLFGLTLRSLFMHDESGDAWISYGLPERVGPPTPFNFTSLRDGTIVLPGMGGLLFSKSPSGPWTWRSVFDSAEPAFAVRITEDQRIFASFRNGGTFVSGDGGVEWAPVELPTETRGVFVSPAGTFLAFGESVYRADGNSSWVEVESTQHIVFSVEACGDKLFFGSTPNGAFESLDDGRTWRSITDEISATAQQEHYLAVHSILCLPNDELLVATFSDGTFHRGKDGVWSNVTAGLPSRSAGDIALGVDGLVYISTTSGVYSSTRWNERAKKVTR